MARSETSRRRVRGKGEENKKEEERKKKKKKKRRGSSSSDESDASSSSLAELRRRRLIREQGEGARSAKLLAAREVAGESLPDGRGNRYNAQFFPDRARQR